MALVRIDEERVASLISVIRQSYVPEEQESEPHRFAWPHGACALANSYFAIVAICHQTTPLGERPLVGSVDGSRKYGWDYLKEKFLAAAASDLSWSTPERWSALSPNALGQLYEDAVDGRTLNRIAERAYFLNDIGEQMARDGLSDIEAAFDRCLRSLGGDAGFLRYVERFVAYSDPVRKKALFFASIAAKECGWSLADPANLRSPVDYHELRGHLRMGTVHVTDGGLSNKIAKNLPITEDEDVELRRHVQQVNDRIAFEAGVTSSVVHYLFWNVFRNCCPRISERTHCNACPSSCGLPDQYRMMPTHAGRCIFSNICSSANMSAKLLDPAYIGHYY